MVTPILGRVEVPTRIGCTRVSGIDLASEVRKFLFHPVSYPRRLLTTPPQSHPTGRRPAPIPVSVRVLTRRPRLFVPKKSPPGDSTKDFVLVGYLVKFRTLSEDGFGPQRRGINPRRTPGTEEDLMSPTCPRRFVSLTKVTPPGQPGP